ncbi:MULTISPECIES: cold-shock protein [Pseudomonas fluorescens group]|uniref:CspA_3 protein n=1 Tax=Pseudomonas fluorescens TaxID=294 RepID=A0A0D0TGN3_PSEFL|nr:MULTISPECIES: cold-shock protein [Pseudomonas fluorescens group]AZE62421.1 Cold shock protein of CSP family [Pseudomonas synxantha]KIR21264.1 Cold shock protein CspA [Pseudomonas fluorescens]
MSEGTVKWFNAEKRFGFIAPDGGGKDIHVHWRELQNRNETLREGQRVSFELVSGTKGPVAADVKVL